VSRYRWLRRSLSALALSFSLGVAGATTLVQQDNLERFRLCGEMPRVSTAGWRRVSYEGLSFMLPSTFRLDTKTRLGFEHGGQVWSHRGRTVYASRGYWAHTSFDIWGESRCRVEINGREALYMAMETRDDVSVQVWLPGLSPVLNASSSRLQDLPMLRAIIFSAVPSQP
jgi:hypothetical protein